MSIMLKYECDYCGWVEIKHVGLKELAKVYDWTNAVLKEVPNRPWHYIYKEDAGEKLECKLCEAKRMMNDELNQRANVRV